METIFIFFVIVFIILIVVHIPFYKPIACQRWKCAEWVSWFFMLSLVLMVIILTLSLAKTNLLDPSHLHSAIAPTASALSQHAPESFNHTISSTMTAIAVVIAVITLLLSLGSSWLMRELTKVDRLKIKLKKLEIKFAQKSEVMVDFWKARQALQEWIEANAESADRWATYNQLVVWLEMLMSEDESVRKKAFEELTKYFPTEEDIYSVPSGVYLLPIKMYSENCHYLHGGTNKSSTWCRIFSRKERYDWANAENNNGVFI